MGMCLALFCTCQLTKSLVDNQKIGPEKGVMHLAVAAIINALWDLWAKFEDKPLWKLLTDLEPEVSVPG